MKKGCYCLIVSCIKPPPIFAAIQGIYTIYGMRPRRPSSSSSHSQSSGRQSPRFHPFPTRSAARPVQRQHSLYELVDLPNDETGYRRINENGSAETPDQSSDTSGNEIGPLAGSSGDTSGDETGPLSGLTATSLVDDLYQVSIEVEFLFQS